MKWVFFLACGVWFASSALADDATPDSKLEIIEYKAPAGWQVSEKPGQTAKVYVSPDSTATQQAVILILITPPQDNLNLKTGFEAVGKQMTQNGKIVQSSEVTAGKTRLLKASRRKASSCCSCRRSSCRPS